MTLHSLKATRLGWSGAGAVAYLLAQVHDATAGWGMPLLMLCCLVGALRGSIEFSIRPGAVELALLVFATVWAVCAWAGLDPSRSLSLSMPLLALLVLVPAVGRERSAETAVAAMVWSVAALATVWSVMLLAAWVDTASIPAERVSQARAPWLMVPNDLAFVALLWPVWIGAVRDARWRWRVLVGAMLVLQAAALATLHSRLGLLLCAVALLLTGLDAWRARGRSRRWLLAVCALSLPATLLLYDKGLRSLEARWELWCAGLEVFVLHPWFGVGPHNYVLAYRGTDALAAALLDPRVTPWPHNLFVELLAETGVFGCLAGVALLACAALSVPQQRRGTWLAVALPCVLLCLLEASTLRAWFWALAAIGLAGASRYRIQGTCRNN